jgi:hypothetical protein
VKRAAPTELFVTTIPVSTDGSPLTGLCVLDVLADGGILQFLLKTADKNGKRYPQNDKRFVFCCRKQIRAS